MDDVEYPLFFRLETGADSWSGLLIAGGFSVFRFAHRSALKFDAVSVVNKPVQNAVSHGGITDLIVPLSDRHLTGENRRACLVAIIADFEEIPALAIGEGSHGPVIDEKHIDAGDAIQQPAQATVGAGNGQITKQTGSAYIQRSESFADRLLRQSASDKTFADATGSG